MADVTLPAFPAPLHWLNEPETWHAEGDGTLVITAGAGTDLFSDPGEPNRYANAPALVGRLDGDFTLSARVRLDLAATFDAAVLLLHADAGHWAKFCLELSPQGVPTVVSVVNRGVSDDCNSLPMSGDDIRLRVSRVGSAFAFHISQGGGAWSLIRYFALDGDPEVGFLAQSPTGDGVTVRFEDIRYAPKRLSDLRDGE